MVVDRTFNVGTRVFYKLARAFGTVLEVEELGRGLDVHTALTVRIDGVQAAVNDFSPAFDIVWAGGSIRPLRDRPQYILGVVDGTGREPR